MNRREPIPMQESCKRHRCLSAEKCLCPFTVKSPELEHDLLLATAIITSCRHALEGLTGDSRSLAGDACGCHAAEPKTTFAQCDDGTASYMLSEFLVGGLDWRGQGGIIVALPTRVRCHRKTVCLGNNNHDLGSQIKIGIDADLALALHSV